MKTTGAHHVSYEDPLFQNKTVGGVTLPKVRVKLSLKEGASTATADTTPSGWYLQYAVAFGSGADSDAARADAIANLDASTQTGKVMLALPWDSPEFDVDTSKTHMALRYWIWEPGGVLHEQLILVYVMPNPITASEQAGIKDHLDGYWGHLVRDEADGSGTKYWVWRPEPDGAAPSQYGISKVESSYAAARLWGANAGDTDVIPHDWFVCFHAHADARYKKIQPDSRLVQASDGTAWLCNVDKSAGANATRHKILDAATMEYCAFDILQIVHESDLPAGYTLAAIPTLGREVRVNASTIVAGTA